MPPPEVEITVGLVKELIADQRPDLADRDISPIGFGWDNISFRVGDDLVARIPRRSAAVPLVSNEARWLPILAPRLPLPVPTPVFVGTPNDMFPWPWTLVPWIPGDRLGQSSDVDLESCAADLGRFLVALHSPAPPEAPTNPFRGVPLGDRASAIEERVHQLRSEVDAAAALEVWGDAMAAPPHTDAGVWIHGDFHPANLLVREGRISGVLDFGDIASGDPATDLSVAWMLFPVRVREQFWDDYEATDEPMLARARGWALAFALAFLANSADNEAMRTIGESTMRRVLEQS